MIKVITGNILDATEDIICHQVNCQGVMGSGVAKALNDKWPVIKQEYLKYTHRGKDPHSILGNVQLVEVEDGKYVANIFGQLNYGRNKNVRYTDYAALREAFDYLRNDHRKSLAFPYGFGCGLANGDWPVVRQLIIDAFCDDEHGYDMDITIYKLPE